MRLLRPLAAAATGAGPLLAIGAVAAIYTRRVLFQPSVLGSPGPSSDVYWADYPNIIYALRALHDGHGLLWNALQNCGQPFLASTLVGLFYPLHAVFLAVGLEHGLMFLAVVHLAIGGLGTYALCRELELGRAAALAGAFAFELGGGTIQVAQWLPYSLLGAYAWMPVAVWRCERVLRTPTITNGIVLGLVLTLQLLIGYPQLLLFTYQVVLLRTVWECLARSVPRLRILAATGLGLALPVALGAAQLFPMIGFARVSIRNRQLPITELNLGEVMSLPVYLQHTSRRMFSGIERLFPVGPVMLAALAVFRTGRWRVPLFYAVIAAIYFGTGLSTPLLDLYRRLPGGQSFRWPQHSLLVTGLGLAVMVAFGVDGLARASGARWAERLLLLPGLLLGAGTLWAIYPSGLLPREWSEVAAFVAVGLWLASAAPGRPMARLALIGLVLASFAALARQPFMAMTVPSEVLYSRRALFEAVRGWMGPQDRVYQVGKTGDFSLEAKSASVFGLSSITDYEPQTSERYAEYFVMLFYGRPMRRPDDFTFHRAGELPRVRRLLDLAAVRYLILDLATVGIRSDEELTRRLGPGLEPVLRDGGVTVYENRQALPRAFYVPRAEVVAPEEQLPLLAALDAQRIALIDAPIPEGGGAANATGDVEITSERSEALVLRVRASDRGFLFLADQYYPGWEATVNGVPAPIVRANHAFRLVPVPQGDSTVVLRYRPVSIPLGIGVSATTAALLVGYAARRAWRRSWAPLT